MPRLFTGLEIPDDIGLDLDLMRGGVPGARWIDRENYHVTLRFIGDIDRDVAADIADSLAGVSRDDFELRIDGIAAFGSKKPHAIVARVEPSRALSELQAEHERRLQRRDAAGSLGATGAGAAVVVGDETHGLARDAASRIEGRHRLLGCCPDRGALVRPLPRHRRNDGDNHVCRRALGGEADRAEHQQARDHRRAKPDAPLFSAWRYERRPGGAAFASVVRR